jgi:hypothetical protein
MSHSFKVLLRRSSNVMLIARRLQVRPTRHLCTRESQLILAGCVAATHDGIPGDEAGACTPLSEITGMSSYYGDVVVSEAKGYTCAQFKIAYPRKFSHMSFDIKITTDCKCRSRKFQLLRCFANIAGRRVVYWLVFHVITDGKASCKRNGDYWDNFSSSRFHTIPVPRRYVMSCVLAFARLP